LPDGRPLLLHVLDYYRAFGLNDFVLCVGYRAAAIEELVRNTFGAPSARGRYGAGRSGSVADGLQVTLVDSGPQAGKSARLLDARPYLGDGEFLLGYADVLSDFDLGTLIASHRGARPVLTLVGTRVRSRFGEFSIDARGAVTGFAEKPLNPALVSAGYFMCAPEVFGLLSADREFEETLVPALVRRGAVRAVVHDGLWLPFDTYKDFVDAETLIRQKGCPWLTQA
jgi:glucose-1-phosphate cytidylyltransferase